MFDAALLHEVIVALGTALDPHVPVAEQEALWHLTAVDGSLLPDRPHLYAPPPPRTRATLGRPRITGRTLLSLQEVVAQITQQPRLTVAWDGGAPRPSEVATDTGPWYWMEEPWGAVRWVYGHAWTGLHRDKYFFPTAVTRRPQPIVEGGTQRWSLATTVQACREDLQLASTTCDGQQSVLRRIPGVFGLSTIVVLRYIQLLTPLQTPRTSVEYSCCLPFRLW